jgi:hypothetical protein
VTRTLADILAAALRVHLHQWTDDNPGGRSAEGDVCDPEECAPAIVAALDPADRESLETGLLLRRVEARMPESTHLCASDDTGEAGWTVEVAWADGIVEHEACRPTLHAALAELLARLGEP